MINEAPRLRRRYLNIIIFLSVAAGYFLWRYAGFNFLVWDDTGSASYNAFSNNCYYSFGNGQFFARGIRNVWAYLQDDGYRPICAMIKNLGRAYFTHPDRSLLVFILPNAVINGLFAVVYFNFCLRFLTTRWASLLALALVIFSTPMITGSALMVYSGNHAIVPFLVLAGLMAYYKLIESTPKFLWLAVLSLIMLLGPWYREFVGLLPLLIIFLELRRCRRITWITVISSLFLLHALFPTAIVKCLLFRDLPLRPVFALGNLGASLKQGISGNLQWRIFIDIISIYPPTIFVLLLTSWTLKLKAKKKIFNQNTVFLSVFFLLSFLPFLKLFREQVHLNYALIPLSILLAMAAEDLWISAGGLRRFRLAAGIALTALIVLIVADHSLNLYAVRKVTLDMHKGTVKLKQWFMDNVPKGTNVITNAHHPDDIRYYSCGYIELWGAPGGIPDMSRWLSPSPADLQKVINLSGPNGVYLLDVEVKDLPGQRNLERKHYYVRNREAMKADMTVDLGILHTMRSRYPFLDPLKYLIPAKAMTWPASPDLEFDFYRGPAPDNTPFLKEVSASYHLYKVAGNKIVISEPILARENYCSFNIIFFKGRYYAILQSEGAFDITRIEQKRYSVSFEGSSVEEAERKIDGYFAIERTKSAGEDPILIEQGYRGFNIIFYKNRFYAILQSDGAFDIKRVENRAYKAVFQGQNPDEVKAAIDKAL